MTTRASLHVRIDTDIIDEMDKSRQDTTRSLFIERAVAKYLTHFKDGGIRRSKK